MIKANTTQQFPLYDFCTLQAEVDNDSQKRIEQASSSIDPTDFYFDQALPHGIHVTVFTACQYRLCKKRKK